MLELVLNWYSREKNSNMQEQGIYESHSDPYSLFIFAINSRVTNEKYTYRLTKYLYKWPSQMEFASFRCLEHLLPGDSSFGHDFLDQAVPQDP
jgi:hypothetical protein